MSNTFRLSNLIEPGDPEVRVMPSYHTSNVSHDHDFFELVYVIEGYCLHNVGGLSTLLMEGDLFVLPPGVPHKYSGNRVTRIYNCVFAADVLDAQLEQLRRLPGLDRLFAADPPADTPLLHLSLSERKAFLRWIKSMCDECETKPSGWEIRVPCELVCLLTEYSRAFHAREDSGRSENAYPAYVRQALSVIDANYSDCDLSVHRIAAEVGVSDDYLSRQFRQVTGVSTQEYLRRYRFARAMNLLQTDISVGEVAREVGFRTLSYFSREFTKELGISPSKYRNQNNDI